MSRFCTTPRKVVLDCIRNQADVTKAQESLQKTEQKDCNARGMGNLGMSESELIKSLQPGSMTMSPTG